MPETQVLSAQLWDLRAHAESKLRALSRVQQQLTSYQEATQRADRVRLRGEIVRDLEQIVTMTRSLATVAIEALSAAESLPE